MTHRETNKRILAVSLSTRGFGFVVLEEPKRLVDWGVKTVEGDKNAQCLVKIRRLIEFYDPDILALEDVHAKGARRAPRIRALNEQMQTLASSRRLKVVLVSATKVRERILGRKEGTRYGVAQKVAEAFPKELALQLPRKRRLWTSEDSRMDVFNAAALACALRKKPPGYPQPGNPSMIQ